MSITDELRTGGIYRFPSNRRVFTEEELTAIADRIDAEYERELRETGEDIVRDVRRDWVKLPVDADGEVWNVGDFAVGEVNPRNPKVIERMIWYGPDSGWQLETDTIIYPCPDRPRHHHASTVEDVLMDLLEEHSDPTCDATPTELVEKYASRLRLAGDSE